MANDIGRRRNSGKRQVSKESSVEKWVGRVVGSGNERIRVAYSRCNWTLTATSDVMRFASFHFAKSADESASFLMISGLSVSCIRSKIPLRYTTRNT